MLPIFSVTLYICLLRKQMIFAKFEASWDTLLNLEKKIPSWKKLKVSTVCLHGNWISDLSCLHSTSQRELPCNVCEKSSIRVDRPHWCDGFEADYSDYNDDKSAE